MGEVSQLRAAWWILKRQSKPGSWSWWWTTFRTKGKVKAETCLILKCSHCLSIMCLTSSCSSWATNHPVILKTSRVRAQLTEVWTKCQRWCRLCSNQTSRETSAVHPASQLNATWRQMTSKHSWRQGSTHWSTCFICSSMRPSLLSYKRWTGVSSLWSAMCRWSSNLERIILTAWRTHSSIVWRRILIRCKMSKKFRNSWICGFYPLKTIF